MSALKKRITAKRQAVAETIKTLNQKAPQMSGGKTGWNKGWNKDGH